LSDPKHPDMFEGRAIVFDGPEDYHARIDDPSLAVDENCFLVMRGTGVIGYPGAAEVVNMRPPKYLIMRGITMLPCIGDGRQSGTSASPSILNASPEAAAGGGLAILKTGDRIRVDLRDGQPTFLPRTPNSPSAGAHWQRPAATNTQPRKHHGRRFSAA
jgi:dihydroxy-acid dehydratase